MTAFIREGRWSAWFVYLIFVSVANLLLLSEQAVGALHTLMDYDGTLMVNTQMATGVILAIPLILIFMIFQRQLIDGITVGILT